MITCQAACPWAVKAVTSPRLVKKTARPESGRNFPPRSANGSIAGGATYIAGYGLCLG